MHALLWVQPSLRYGGSKMRTLVVTALLMAPFRQLDKPLKSAPAGCKSIRIVEGVAAESYEQPVCIRES